MTGFGRSIKEESDSKVKEHMLDHAINLLKVAADFSCSSAKLSYVSFLCQMEQGEITR